MSNNSATKRSRATNEQLSQMVDFMFSNPGLAGGKFQKLHGKVEYDRKWNELSELLNCSGGAVKTIDQWHKVWRDLKSRTSIRVRERRKGKRPLSHEPITELERRVMAIIEGDNLFNENIPVKDEHQFFEDGDEFILEMASCPNTSEIRCTTPNENSMHWSDLKKRRVEDCDTKNEFLEIANRTHDKLLEIVNKQADALKELAESSAENVRIAKKQTEALKMLAECSASNAETNKKIAEAIQTVGECVIASADAFKNFANAVNEFESSDDGEHKKENLRLQRRVMRQRSNIFNLPDNKFVDYFRLNKAAFKFVLSKIEPEMKSRVRSTFTSNTIKLAATLRFLAQGSYQLSVGNDFNLGLSQPTVSLILEETLDALEKIICPLFIKFTTTEKEESENKLGFYKITGFPSVIGCVDGTHIKILSPSKEVQVDYCNRKGFFSINAMIICDHKMRISFVDARYAGSSHDSLIWNMSTARQVLRERYNSGERNNWLLGDASYPLEPFLMTPYRSPAERSPEAIFNSKHAKTWNIIERTIGILKNNFRCLLGDRQLHYKPAKATKIVNVCAALHNVCIEYNSLAINYETPTNDNESNYDDFNNIDSENILIKEAIKKREEIKASFL